METINILKVVFDALPSIVFVVDQDVRIQEYNTAASDLLMADRMIVIRQRAGDILYCAHSRETPEGCGRASSCKNCVIRNSVNEAFHGNRVVRRRTRIELIRNGNTIEVSALVSASPIVFQNRSFVLLVIEDIDEDINSLPQMFFETDDKGNITFVNRQFEIDFGFTIQDIQKGLNIAQSVAPEDAERALEHFKMTISGKNPKPFEGRLLKKDGSIISAIVYPKAIIRNDKIIGSKGFLINVTEQKRAEKALRESEERLSLAVKAASLGIWDWDIRKQVSVWNNKMFEIYGIPKENPIKYKKWAKMLVPEDYPKAKAVFHKIIANKGNDFVEFRIIRPDGITRHIQTGMGAITDENDRVIRLVGINIDISERKQNEEEREKLISELQQALAKVKQLSGCLPICCNCKKIRDDNGSWTQIEAYIHEHSEAQFTHGLCEECLRELYPDFS